MKKPKQKFLDKKMDEELIERLKTGIDIKSMREFYKDKETDKYHTRFVLQGEKYCCGYDLEFFVYDYPIKKEKGHAKKGAK